MRGEFEGDRATGSRELPFRASPTSIPLDIQHAEAWTVIHDEVRDESGGDMRSFEKHGMYYTGLLLRMHVKASNGEQQNCTNSVQKVVRRRNSPRPSPPLGMKAEARRYRARTLLRGIEI